MKTTIVLAAISLLMGLAGCAPHATQVSVPPSTALPAATGEAKVTRDANNNSVVRLKVEHVAPPGNLQPPKQVYVVWLETPDNQRINFGQLKIDQNRKGEIKGTTPYKVFRLVVTAEDSATATQPSDQVVLTTGMLEAK